MHIKGKYIQELSQFAHPRKYIQEPSQTKINDVPIKGKYIQEPSQFAHQRKVYTGTRPDQNK